MPSPPRLKSSIEYLAMSVGIGRILVGYRRRKPLVPNRDAIAEGETKRHCRQLRYMDIINHLVAAAGPAGLAIYVAVMAFFLGSVITNPPYESAQAFIEHALDLTGPRGIVAALLRTDFGHAKRRQHLFGSCTAFYRKVELTKRVRWFEGSTGSPSFNHCWMIWKNDNRGPPTLAYAGCHDPQYPSGI
jgi:hypothetical protein